MEHPARLELAQADYKSATLPIELARHQEKHCNKRRWPCFSRGYYLHTVVILGLYVHTTYGTRYFRPNMLVSSLGNLSPLSATNGLHIGFIFVLTVFPFAALRVVLPTPRQDSNLHYQDKYQRPYYRNYIFNCTWRFYRGYQTPAIL